MQESEKFSLFQNGFTMNTFTTASEANDTIRCPPLLRATADGDGCEYNDGAYAVFAIVAIIIAGIPFAAFVCYVHRKVKKKQEARARGRAYSASLESSSPYPYQVSDNHNNNICGRGKNIRIQNLVTATKIHRDNNNFLPAEVSFLLRFCWA